MFTDKKSVPHMKCARQGSNLRHLLVVSRAADPQATLIQKVSDKVELNKPAPKMVVNDQ
jgi:hypothetical protein